MIEGVLIAVAALVGMAIVLSVVMVAAASVSRSGSAPQGGIRRDLPQHPQSDTDDDRVLVLR
jgi:hypothetical protein